MAEFLEDLMLEGQCPCEFCDELFPFDILIEHQTGCNPDLTSFGVDDYEYTIPRSTDNTAVDFIASAVEKVKIEIKDANQSKYQEKDVEILPKMPVQSAHTTSPVKISPEKSEVKKIEEKTQTTPGPKLDFINELKEAKKFQQRRSDFKLDDLSSYTGERLMSFGSAADDATKECDNDKAHQDSADEGEDIEDINNLSDEDCGETLEEFWKRARDFLKRQRVKNI